MRSSLVCLALAMFVAHGTSAQQQPPRFQSSVEVTSIDVTVVDGDGRPVTDLQPGDFTVRIDGSERRVVNVEWVPLARPDGPPPPPAPAGYSSNEGGTGGRLVLIVVDQPNIRPGEALGLLKAAGDFIDRLEPSDRVAAVSLGIGSGSTPFTADHGRVKQALGRMTGSEQGTSMFEHDVAVSEAVAIANDPSRENGFVFTRVVSRECARLDDALLEACRDQIFAESVSQEREVRIAADQTLRSLTFLFEDLKTIDVPKTMLLVSGGPVVRDQEADIFRLGSLAAEAQTTVYALKIDDFGLDASVNRSAAAGSGDRVLRTEGLELLASASRGAMFNVIGTGTAALARIESELRGYYLLGIESEPRDKDGKTHPINVGVGRRGLTVRARRQLGATAGGRPPRSPRESVMAGLSSPLLLSALSLRVATFSVREPETSKVQVLIHADVGRDYPSSRAVSLGYVISDKDGRIVESQAAEARLLPVMSGVPSPLQFLSTASLEPGDYDLKMSVVEGDRIGTVEHPIHAGLVPAGPVLLSELMVGGPFANGDLLRPTVGYTVTFGTVHGYLEAYGPDGESLAVKYEVAAAEDEPALLETDASGVPAGHERVIFSETLQIARLPPGRYVLRAVVSSPRSPLKTMVRPFEIAAPAVLMTSAESTGSIAAPPADVYLPVTSDRFIRPFRREEASRAETLRMFRESVTPESRAAFDKGAAFLSSGDYANAEQSFKNALRTDDQSSVALAYLGVTFAASGHDTEAAGAWQTSLIDASDFPQIFEWLADALMRLNQLAEAKTVLEEAVAKWPSDLRFAKPLALVYATFGQGREATRMLERHLAERPDDPDALALGVEWIYHLHAAGAAAHAPAEDLKLATTWANAYARVKGPQAALVKEWLQALQGRER